MKDLSSARLGSPDGCRITSHALVECRLSEIKKLRSSPLPAGGPPLPPRFLRHADEQTVVGLLAVLEAIARQPQWPDVTGHAVIAAPCQSGRLSAAHTLAQLALSGATSVSPHIVPQCSLHSVAGAVSVALGMHGPHLGVGGGPDALSEGLVAATMLLAGHGEAVCTAAWLVATDWDEEPSLDTTAEAEGDPVCRGLALLLESATPPNGDGEEDQSLPLAIRQPARQSRSRQHSEPAGGLVAFARALRMCQEGGALTAWTIGCPWGGEIRVTAPRRVAAPAGLREAA